jgi:hypothetical protein
MLIWTVKARASHFHSRQFKAEEPQHIVSGLPIFEALEGGFRENMHCYTLALEIGQEEYVDTLIYNLTFFNQEEHEVVMCAILKVKREGEHMRSRKRENI